MKQKLLNSFRLRWCMIVAVMMMCAGGQAWGDDEVYKTALFGSSYNENNSSYTGSFDATNESFVVTVTYFNNNSNQWTNSSGLGQIKCGRKNYTSVATIITKDAIDKAITKVDITIDAITTDKINNIKLYTSSNNSTWTEAGSFTKAKGTQSVILPTPTANLYYKVAFDCASGSSNGLLTLSKVEYYTAAPPSTYSVTYNANGATSGLVPTDDTAYSSGDNVTVLGNTDNLEKTGYAFGGWNTKEDGTGSNYTAGNTFEISANTTLYAKWDLVATALSVNTPPSKVDYKIGETLDLSGLVLSATIGGTPTDVSSGYTATISGTAVTSGTTVLNSAGDQTITFTYGGQTTTQVINVGTLSSLTYNSTGEGAFANTTYTENDYFNPTGLVVTAHYTNGINEVVNDYTLSPNTSAALATNNTYVTVSYTWAGTQQTVDIPITVNAGTKYTVSFNAGNGTYTGGDITEEEYQGGISLPTPTSVPTDWTFFGWAESQQTIETTTAPTVTDAGETYYPTANITLYAVYKFTENGTEIVTGANLTGSATSATQLNAGHPITYEISASNSYSNPLRVYKNNTLTIAGATMSKIVLSGDDSSNPISNLSLQSGGGTLSNGTWTGSSTEVVFKANAQARVSSIQVTYTSSTTTYTSLPAPKAELSYPAAEYNGVWGRSFSKPTLTNPNEVTVTYQSSNTDVATVDAENGDVTIVGVGSAVITASFAGNATYRANSASYTLNTCYGTIAQIKDLTNDGTPINFTANLEDAIVTYVKDNFAYIQDASAAVQVNFADHGLTAGKKINGSVTGTVKASNQIDVLTAFDTSDAEVTNDGDIPAATVATLATIKSAGTAYDGKLITVNGGTVTGSISSDGNSGASIKDGTKINDTDVQFSLYAPNKGIEVNATEQGNFTGFVSIYNGETYRLNLYDQQSQIAITRNVATDQPMSFATASYDLSEETDAYTAFTGQTVTGNKGTVTYSIEDGDDANGVVTSINSSTGAVVLSGNYGTATITATAASTEETVAGVTTPYNETVKTYTVYVGPRYSVTFHVNGSPTTLREETHDAGVTVPTPAAVGEYQFRGWRTSALAATDTEPNDFVDLSATIHPTDNNGVYYAVYARRELGTNISATFKASDKSNLNISGSTFTDKVTGITLSSTSADTQSFDVTTGNYYEITVDGYFTSIVATVLSSYSDHIFSTTSAGTLSTSGGVQTITFDENDGEVSTVRLTNNETSASYISQFVVNAVGYGYSDYCTTIAPLYAVTVSDVTNGSITVKKGEKDVVGKTVHASETLNLAATPTTGYKLKNWTATAGTITDATAATTTFTMPAQAVTIGAEFEKDSYDLSLEAVDNHGTFTVTVDGAAWDGTSKIPYDSEVSITANANSNYAFASWSTTLGSVDITTNPLVFHMPADGVMIEASFDDTTIEYDIVISNPTGGTIGASVAKATVGTEITLTATPDDATYQFAGWEVIDDDTNPVTVTNNKFIMPANDVLVSGTFKKIYTVTYYIAGVETVVNRLDGDELDIDDPAAHNGMAFSGWSTTDNAASPSFLASTTVSSDLTLYAMFVEQEGEVIYRKATTISAGDYLIVCEDGNVAFNSALTTLDATNNYVSVTINNGTIESSSSVDDAVFTIAEMTGGYSIKSSSNKYIWRSTTSNGMDESESPNANSITITNGDASISSNNTFLKYNASNDQKRFRYFKSGQTAIQLYKKEASTPVYTLALPASVTIPASGYLAYCYGSKLDFSNTDVKAYKASVNSTTGKVTLTKVDVVPAAEGVILYCATPDSYSIPVTGEAASDVTGNEMVGVLERTQVLWNVDDKYNYILQQGQFNKASDGYLKANRAYLSTTYDVTAAGVRPLSIVFDDETGIDMVQGEGFTVNGPIYNLAGQRLSKPQRGVNIINGKKVLIK